MDFKPVMPRELVPDKDTLTSSYGKFTAEPFERGFGTTIGNSLRRILLSSVQGAAVVWVRIAGVDHEFAVLEGVKEDVLDIVLNLKSLNIKMSGHKSTAMMTLDVTGSGPVTAAKFKADPALEILNPDQHIATLASSPKGQPSHHLKIEACVQMGRGYVPAGHIKELSPEAGVFGTIFVDALFSPIRNVKYTVEAARVGQQTDYDRLLLEVFSNGTVEPREAVSYAAKVVRDHLAVFISTEDQSAEMQALEEVMQAENVTASLQEKLDKSIEELELSVRSHNCLEAAGIKTIRDLVQKSESEMLKYRNFGRKSLNEIKTVLKNMSLKFGIEIDPVTAFPNRRPRNKARVNTANQKGYMKPCDTADIAHASTGRPSTAPP